MASNSSTQDYAGDLSALEAWELMKADPRAVLVDVRTKPEWTFVGLPDLAELKRDVQLIEWQSFPSMEVNPSFAAAVSQSAADKDTPLLFLCRSGARSKSAAIALTGAGYRRAYNVAGGFEGDLDGERHRGTKNGWKASGLPWKQS